MEAERYSVGLGALRRMAEVFGQDVTRGTAAAQAGAEVLTPWDRMVLASAAAEARKLGRAAEVAAADLERAASAPAVEGREADALRKRR